MAIKQKTILVVDDDNDILKFLNKILTSAGFTVVTASSPEEAYKLIALAPPHLVISDLNMEPIDGYHFIQSLRHQKAYAELPVIVLSTVNEFSTVKKVIALGINDYAIKPIQPPMLLRKIKKTLHNKEFATWTPEGTGPDVSLIVDAEVIEMGETGYRIAGTFKLTPGKRMKITVPEFTAMGIEKYHQQASSLMKSFMGGGLFSNDITFLAIDEEGAGSIRKFVRKSTVK